MRTRADKVAVVSDGTGDSWNLQRHTGEAGRSCGKEGADMGHRSGVLHSLLLSEKANQLPSLLRAVSSAWVRQNSSPSSFACSLQSSVCRHRFAHHRRWADAICLTTCRWST